jgi:DNA-binding response OmpR family regulator
LSKRTATWHLLPLSEDSALFLLYNVLFVYHTEKNFCYKGVFFMLERCSVIDKVDIRYDDEQASIVINNRVLRFSPTEYKLIRLFLLHTMVQETLLFEAVSLNVTDANAQKLLTKYINKIRNKIAASDFLLLLEGLGRILRQDK